MKKKVLAAGLVLGSLFSVAVGTLFVSFVGANPLWFLGFVTADRYTRPPVVSIFSPANNAVFDTDSVVLSFKVDVGTSETALNKWINHVWVDTTWHHRDPDSFFPPVNSSSFSKNVTLTGIPRGNHSITVNAMEYGNYTEAPFLISNSRTVFFTINTTIQTEEEPNDYLLAEDDPVDHVPEFPSWTILPLTVAITLIAALMKKRRRL